MAERGFEEASARAKVKETIAAVERETSAEVMVALRWRSGSYRDAHLLAGAFVAFVVLVVMMFVPYEFKPLSFPVNAAITFALGAWVASSSSGVGRSLTSGKRRRAAVHAYARAAFVDLGVSRTHHRCGLLVYVSMLERTIEIVADQGVRAAVPEATWREIEGRFAGALLPKPDFPRFVDALRSLGPALGAFLPPAEHENELPDDVDASDPS